jgi:alpha-D-ribose 1-methylphosphonate 5-phosphate C-P lyase
MWRLEVRFWVVDPSSEEGTLTSSFFVPPYHKSQKLALDQAKFSIQEFKKSCTYVPFHRAEISIVKEEES